MCGIAGVVETEGSPSYVEDQVDRLRHRGPDSAGVFERGRGAVGQSRLAIIDLVTGDPPITDESGRLGVAFNGEIYNYQALRAQLEVAGHDMKTTGDTEVIAHLAEDLEPVDLARVLDGMFAFAVWDEARDRLILGRDRMGKKPLYYWVGRGGQVVFGSEIKAVLADPRVPRSLDPKAIPAYLTFGYVPTPYTFYEGIQSLPPGHVLVAQAGATPVIEAYWRPQVPGADNVERVDLSYAEAGREVRRLFVNAVEKRMVADVPLGAFLSGGVDSSAVVAMLARLSPRPVRTFTIGFDDQSGFDERPYARDLARRFGTDHTEFVVKPDAAELIERLVWHHDQPFGDSSALPTYLLSELTKRHVTVALSGDGGDELFAGYERFAAALALERLNVLPPAVPAFVSKRVAAIPRSALGGRVGSVRRMLDRASDELPWSFLSWVSYVPEEWRQRLIDDPSDWARCDYAEIFAESEGADPLDRLLVLNLRTYLLDDLLPKADRMSMAHGLEVRSPFLDRDLVDFALRLPRSYRVKGMSLKRIFKEAARDVLPHDLLHRRKHGFGLPLDRWFRTDLRTYVESTLGGADASIGRHLRHSEVRSLLAEHQSGVADLGHAIWTLLTLEVFLRREGW
jgi:asparagine synthase (glutamine-hydrolysing)